MTRRLEEEASPKDIILLNLFRLWTDKMQIEIFVQLNWAIILELKSAKKIIIVTHFTV